MLNFSIENVLQGIDRAFSWLVIFIEQFLFFSIAGMPLIILWLIAGGIFCTLRMGFINIIGFRHALKIAFGKDNSQPKDSAGEVSPFQALATALSGSVGLGNIAGVAIAIQMGGPGAVFWMTVSALLGMAIKFVECTLGLQYRSLKPDGSVTGGPMYYLSGGLKEIGFPQLGQVLAILFALFGIPAALGGGNMFQSNQSFAALETVFPGVRDYDWVFGLMAATLVGSVILGGINRISIVASKLVPFMVAIYLLACLLVIGMNITAIPEALRVIVEQAFYPQAVEGGLVGSLVVGVRRAAFSNNAGLGAAAIAHAVARNKEPIREGIVAILEPFIDTVIICNLTAFVILTTGTYGDGVKDIISGSALAATAFERVIDGFSIILVMIMFLFAFSTTITWSYYGERCWAYLLGESSIIVFKSLFLFCVFLGVIINLGAIVDFSDMMLLGLAIPNLIGCVMLSGKVAQDLQIYWDKLVARKTINFDGLMSPLLQEQNSTRKS